MIVQGSKKKLPKLFFLICFVVVLIITIIANRQSVLAKEISIPLNSGNARSIVLTSLNGDTKSREIALDTGESRVFLNIGRNQNTPIATIAQAKANQQNQTTFTFYLVDTNNNSTQYLFKADAGVDINQWISVSASDDCKLISLCGEKQGRCWMCATSNN